MISILWYKYVQLIILYDQHFYGINMCNKLQTISESNKRFVILFNLQVTSA